MNIHLVRNSVNATFPQSQKSHYARTWCKTKETSYKNANLFFQAPEKKPLVRRDPTEDVQAKVRKGSQKIHSNPVAELEEFMGDVNQQETI